MLQCTMYLTIGYTHPKSNTHIYLSFFQKSEILQGRLIIIISVHMIFMTVLLLSLLTSKAAAFTLTV